MSYKFGTFKGVYTPSVLTILGVVMYLRFGWVLGNSGLFGTLLIVTLSTLITFVTGLSLSSLATNMKVGGGGSYYIISRSLGIEAGAAVGLPLFFAQALGISFYIAGFSEALVDVFPQFSPVIVGVITLLTLAGIASLSADLALKTQFIVMAAVFLSLFSFFAGDATNIELPLASEIPPPEPFWIVFAVFFPAVTGIEAGIAMSGDLKNPAKSLPRGTIAAILTGYAIYIAIPVFLTYLFADISVLRVGSMGLVMRYVARWGNLIILGVWAAALSSAMGVMLGAPRTLQALARDRVIPRFFARGFGKGNNPRIATATAFIVGLTGIVFGDLNAIAPILSMFFLTSYGVLNISAGLEELTGPPSWRPRFRFHWSISLLGALSCFSTMFMINAGATFIAAFVVISVFFAMERRSLRAVWGDMRSGIMMLVARYAIKSLAKRPTDKRTWKPNILVLSGSPTSRWYLIELADAISHGGGFLTVAAVLPLKTAHDRMSNISQAISDYLDKRDVTALVKIQRASSPLKGAGLLAETYGYGPIVPNTILLGISEQNENYADFASFIMQIHSRGQNLVVVREGEDQRKEQKQNARIDVWWYGSQENLGLMIALAHLLTRDVRWKDSEFVLKSMVNQAGETAKMRSRISTFIKNGRIEARADVLLKGSGDVFDSIRTYSSGADLVLLGMRPPAEDETSESYRTYYKELVDKTQGLPPTAIVLAAESIDFFGIFKQT